MGRALYSLAYAVPEPAVRIEPEPEVEPYERWSAWNRFDPDSDDFFQDAEYEAFIDRYPAPMSSLVGAQRRAAERRADSPESGDSSDGERGSPVAPEDNTVILGGRPYNNRPLNQEAVAFPDWSSPFSEYLLSSASLSPVHSPVSPQDTQSPPFIPPPSFRQPSPDVDAESQPLRRTVNIIPINVSHVQVMPATRSPSPDSPATPATPPRTTPLQAMVSPSPPPSVTPRLYSWQHHPIPALPTSPTVIRGNTYTRREFNPVRVRIPNTVT